MPPISRLNTTPGTQVRTSRGTSHAFEGDDGDDGEEPAHRDSGPKRVSEKRRAINEERTRAHVVRAEDHAERDEREGDAQQRVRPAPRSRGSTGPGTRPTRRRSSPNPPASCSSPPRRRCRGTDRSARRMASSRVANQGAGGCACARRRSYRSRTWSIATLNAPGLLPGREQEAAQIRTVDAKGLQRDDVLPPLSCGDERPGPPACCQAPSRTP